MRLYTGLIQYRDIVEPYNPLRCMRQFGYIQTIPKPPPRPTTVYHGPQPERYKVSFPKEMAQSMWDSFPDEHQIVLHKRPSRQHSSDGTTRDYMKWFLSVLHPMISPGSGTESSIGGQMLPSKSHTHYVSNHYLLDLISYYIVIYSLNLFFLDVTVLQRLHMPLRRAMDNLSLSNPTLHAELKNDVDAVWRDFNYAP